MQIDIIICKNQPFVRITEIKSWLSVQTIVDNIAQNWPTDHQTPSPTNNDPIIA